MVALGIATSIRNLSQWLAIKLGQDKIYTNERLEQA
jgi:hypothetical protein